MTRLSALVLVLAAACGSSSKSSSQPAQASGDQHMGDTCVAGWQRARTCSDAFMAAMVDVRAKLDSPPGTAAAVAQDRDAVIAQAKEEWKNDSTDEKIAEQCKAIGEAPIELQHEMADTLDGCLGKASCDEYVACMQPMMEKHMKMAADAQAGAAHHE